MAFQQDSSRQGPQGTPREVKVRLPEGVAAGTYANAMMAQHSPSEFVLDFAFIAGTAGEVVARVITNPSHMKRIIGALQENMERYEKVHGKVATAKEAGFRMGFHPPEGGGHD
jgi:hypothetical protein